jgi:hypothetical protein
MLLGGAAARWPGLTLQALRCTGAKRAAIQFWRSCRSFDKRCDNKAVLYRCRTGAVRRAIRRPGQPHAHSKTCLYEAYMQRCS